MIPEWGRSSGEGIGYPLQYSWASLVAQLVNKWNAMWDTWIQSLSWKDPLENGRLPTPVFWPGEFHGLYSPRGRKESDTTEHGNEQLSPSLSGLNSITVLIGSFSFFFPCKYVLQ